MDLAGGLDQVLEVGAGEEVTEVDEFAVPLVFDVDGAPAVLAGGDVAAVVWLVKELKKGYSSSNSPVNVHGVLGANDSEWNDGFDLGVHSSLLRVVLLVLVRVHPDVVESELLLDAVLELLALLESKRIGFGDDGNDVDSLAQLLEDNDIDRLEAVARRGDEVEAAVDAGVLDVAGWKSAHAIVPVLPI